MTKRGNTYAARGLKPLRRMAADSMNTAMLVNGDCPICGYHAIHISNQTIGTKYHYTTYRCDQCEARLQVKEDRSEE
jgi:hypothetical protein